MLRRRGAGAAQRPLRRYPTLSVHECELVLMDLVHDLAAQVRRLDVRIPEVNPCPDACLDYLVGQIREAMEHTLLAREPAARGIERHIVGPEERLERVHAGAGV